MTQLPPPRENSALRCVEVALAKTGVGFSVAARSSLAPTGSVDERTSRPLSRCFLSQKLEARLKLFGWLLLLWNSPFETRAAAQTRSRSRLHLSCSSSS